jgi:hypothetical protein
LPNRKFDVADTFHSGLVEFFTGCLWPASSPIRNDSLVWAWRMSLETLTPLSDDPIVGLPLAAV